LAHENLLINSFQTLARVIGTVAKFQPDQLETVLRREEARAHGSMGLNTNWLGSGAGGANALQQHSPQSAGSQRSSSNHH